MPTSGGTQRRAAHLWRPLYKSFSYVEPSDRLASGVAACYALAGSLARGTRWVKHLGYTQVLLGQPQYQWVVLNGLRRSTPCHATQ